MLTDKIRVSLALPSRLLLRCVTAIIEGTRHDFKQPVDAGLIILRDDLRACCEEPLYGLERKKAEKLRARIDRAAVQILEPYESHALAKVAQLVMRWVCARLDAGDLILCENSTFESCFNRFQNALFEHKDLWVAVEDSAKKQVSKLHARVQSLGFFGG